MPQSLPLGQFAVSRPPVSARQGAKARVIGLIPLLVVFYSFLLLPPEVEVTMAGVNLPSYRIALLAVLVPVLWSTLRNMGSKPVNLIDVAVAIVGGWIMLSFMLIYGFSVGLVRGAGITIDTVLPYLVARSCVKSLDDLRYFLILCLPGLAVAGAALMVESLMGRMIVRPAFASVFGAMNAFEAGEAAGSLALGAEYRLGGLLRAYGTFPHPILAGVMMIGFMPLYYFSGLRSWPYIGGVLVTLTGFFGLSSAAFLALMLAVGAIGIYHVKPFFPKISWWTISGLLILALWTMHVVSKSGIIYVISRLTLTPHTAEYRLNIWHWGGVNIAKNPWFGIGYRQWERFSWMGESVDAHFLLLAMRHGLIVPIVLIAAIFYGMVKLGRIIPYLAPKDRAFAIGLNISIIIFVMVGQTVSYFGSGNIEFMTFVAFLASAVTWGNQQLKVQQLASRRAQARHLMQLA